MLVTVFAKKGKNCATAVSTAVALRIIPAERYQQFWKFCQENLFPNMETIIFAQNSKQ